MGLQVSLQVGSLRVDSTKTGGRCKSLQSFVKVTVSTPYDDDRGSSITDSNDDL